MGWIIPLVVLAVLAALPLLAERKRHASDAFRAQAPGRFAKLSQGVTHYQWLGSTRGPVIVCIHGLGTPSPVWYAIAAGLGKMGFRVLVYDLYGRGFSDAPRGPQSPTFFNKQLLDLLNHQEITGEVTVMGYSMGGSIAAAFAAAHPDRVQRMILLAGGGMAIRTDRLTELCLTAPVIGDWLFHVVVARKDRRRLRAQLGQAFDIKGITELQLSEYESKGFLRSVLSSQRHMLSLQLEDEHRAIGRSDIPVIGIWAEKDSLIPLRSLGMLSQWNRSVRQEVVNGASHAVPYTHSKQVIDILGEILVEDAL